MPADPRHSTNGGAIRRSAAPPAPPRRRGGATSRPIRTAAFLALTALAVGGGYRTGVAASDHPQPPGVLQVLASWLVLTGAIGLAVAALATWVRGRRNRVAPQ